MLAGTEPNGILYRISAKDKAFVLYDASLPEIRTIVPMPDGTVYAAALGGSVANRSRRVATRGFSRPSASPSRRRQPPSRFRIPHAQAGPDLKAKPDPSKQAAQPVQQVTTADRVR